MRRVLACLSLLAALPAVAVAQSDGFRFAAPVRIAAGDALLGEGRLYPSPMLHDGDRDGVPDVYVGDLRGRITLARGARKDGVLHFLPEQKLMAADGSDLDFHNW